MAIPVKSWALILSFLGLLAVPASARLGETSAELEERFGQGSEPGTINGWFQQQIFQAHGFEIIVSMIDGASVAEQYTPHNAALTRQQVETLLQIDSQTHKWIAQPADPTGHDTRTRWRREDGAEATLNKNSLFIASRQFIEGAEAYSKAQAPSVQGF